MVNPEDTYWNSFLPAFIDRMSMQMRKNMNTIVEPYGLTNGHAIYLIALRLQDGQTLVNLSRFLDLDAANTNRVIKVLREKEFIYDDREKESGKKYHVFLTQKGRDLAQYIMNKINELNNSYFEGIPRKDILNMRNTLIKVSNNLSFNIDAYMGSRHEDPFYTLLHIIPHDGDYEGVPVTAPKVGRKRNQ